MKESDAPRALPSRGFAKLDSGIVDSSLWMLDHDALRVWVYLLAKVDALGILRASAPAMAHACRLTLERFEEIMRGFEAPDAYSRSSEHDGRRIERIEGGWVVLNYLRYRELLQRKAGSHAERQARYYQRKKEQDELTGRTVTPDASPVTPDALTSDLTQKQKQRQRQSKEAGAQAPPPAAYPVFPTKGTPDRWTLTEDQANKWAALYPHIDIDKACRKAWGYVDADPKYTARGMATFLNNWLGRETGCRRELPAAREAAKARDEATALDLARRALTARAFTAGEKGTISAADRERIVTEAEAATSREALEAIRWP